MNFHDTLTNLAKSMHEWPKHSGDSIVFDGRIIIKDQWIKRRNELGFKVDESTLVPREEMNDLDWLARNVHKWKSGYDLAVVQRGGGEIYVTWPSVCSSGITKKQWLSRRAELQNKPSWDTSPKWARSLFQNFDGRWFWVEFSTDKNGDSFWTLALGSSGKQKYASSGEVLGDWRDTLEKRPKSDEAKSDDTPIGGIEGSEYVLYDPFVRVEGAATAKQPAITPSKYTKTINGVSVDVYDVLQAWNVINPALQHLIKKALQCGQRGHKDNVQDLQDIIDSAIRAKELGL